MNARELVLDKLKLRTHPFSPEIGPDGQPLTGDLVAKSLDPRKDARLLSYYFDVYNWENSSILRGLSRQQALEKFPQRGDLRDEGPILFLVSGTSQTGHGSLVNLVLYKIRETQKKPPIIVEISFDSFDKAQNVKEMAGSFMDTYATEETVPSYDQLSKIYERETREKSTGTEAHFTALFKSFSLLVKKSCDRPIIFLITGKDHFDLWSCIYNSTRPLADYLIVETSKLADATTCWQRMTTEAKNVAHVDALTLDLETARRYLIDRLSFERTAGWSANVMNDLSPFTEDALRVLYEQGTDTKTAAPVRHSIGWLRETFRRALKDHIEELAEMAETKGHQELDNIPPNRLLLDGEKMWKVRQTMNQGR